LIKNHHIQLLIRLVIIVINGIAIFYFYQKETIITTIVFGLILVFQFFLFIDFFKKEQQEIEKSIDCLLYDDYSVALKEDKNKTTLHNKMARLIAKYKKVNIQKSTEEVIFTNILESLSIGILILRRDNTTKKDIEVFQLNKAFVDFLKIPKYYNWSLLNQKIPAFTKLVDTNNWQSFKEVITLKINNQEESFFLKTSLTKTYNYEYLILSLETIQQLIDKKEKEAWYKLMNVMSHEIINTITPISSLAGNLGSLLADDLDTETKSELKKGLSIIKRRSHHLTEFVNSYRKLAELPTPNKIKVSLNNLIENTLSLFEQQFKKAGILIVFSNVKDIAIQADKQQIEQVLINIFSNCFYALKNIKNPKITITLIQKDNRTTLKITDNGIGIPKEIKNQIFVPYFTTRKDGSGIGLALAKSIIEAHNGSISFTSKKEKTAFELNFN